jgi:tetratricopeptide (TPR) repeat protein
LADTSANDGTDRFSGFIRGSETEVQRLNEQYLKLYQQGKYIEAIPLAEQALAIQKKVLGNNHPDVATTLDDLGTLYSLQDNPTNAKLRYQQALTIRKQQLGDSHQ